LEETIKNKDDADHAIVKVTKCLAGSSVRKSTYGGFLMPGLPCFWYQITGEKVFAAVDLREAADWYYESRGGQRADAVQSALELETIHVKDL